MNQKRLRTTTLNYIYKLEQEQYFLESKVTDDSQSKIDSISRIAQTKWVSFYVKNHLLTTK